VCPCPLWLARVMWLLWFPFYDTQWTVSSYFSLATRPRGHKQRKLNETFLNVFCLCSLGLTIKLNFTISKVTYENLSVSDDIRIAILWNCSKKSVTGLTSGQLAKALYGKAFLCASSQDTCYLDDSSFCVILISRPITAVSYPVSLNPLFCVISALSRDACHTSQSFKINL